MKRVYELTVQKHEGQLSNFYFLISTVRERLHKIYASAIFTTEHTEITAKYIIKNINTKARKI